MHIPNHDLDLPTAAATAALAGGALIWAAWQATSQKPQGWQRFAAVSAGIFAGQMVNFAIGGGTSGHLLGGTIAAVLLGPWQAVLSVSLVLAVQCLLFGDGGWQALGANVLNMALAGTLTGYALWTLARRVSRSSWLQVAAGGIGAWSAVMAAALLCSLELAAAGTVELRRVLPAMLNVHAVIGVGEALGTMTVAALMMQFNSGGKLSLGRRGTAVAGLALALAIALFLAPLASRAPDGLERVSSSLRVGFAESAGASFELLPNYKFPGLDGDAWQNAFCGAIGVLAVFALGLAAQHLAAQRVAAGRADRMS